MIILKKQKQPWERKDYDANFSDWLVEGDPVVSSTATVECITTPADTALTIEAPIVSSPFVKVFVAAGTDQQTYKITIRSITAADRRVECEMIIKAKEE